MNIEKQPMMSLPDYRQCFVDSAHGVYVPQQFAASIEGHERSWRLDSDTSSIALNVLRAGPDHPLYWEEWEHVLSTARLPYRDALPINVTPDEADTWVWTLEHDTDLFIVCHKLAEYLGENDDD
jgi:hypothetical protein